MLEKIITILCIFGCIYILFFKKNKSDGGAVNLPESWKLRAVLFSFVVGIYFGFSGAGGGTLTSLILYTFFGINLKYTMGTRKFIHLPIHLVSAGTYYFLGLIHWPIFLTMFVACLTAGWMGSTIAIKMPEHILRRVFFSIIMLLAVWVLI